MLVMHVHLVFFCQVKGDIGCIDEIIPEPLFYLMLLVTGTDDEIVKPVIRLGLHYMPEYGHASDLYHRLGDTLGHLR